MISLTAEANTQAETDPAVLRLSLDAKAAVKIGPFWGKNQFPPKLATDFRPKTALTPTGFSANWMSCFTYFTVSKVATTLTLWSLGGSNHNRFPMSKHYTTQQDNGQKNRLDALNLWSVWKRFASQYQQSKTEALSPYHE